MLTAEQYAIRKTGITASEIGVIAGLSDTREPMDVWVRKVGYVDEQELPTTPEMEIGNVLEEPVAELVATRTGGRLVRAGTFRHPEHGWMLATPDRGVLKADWAPFDGLTVPLEDWAPAVDELLEIKVVGRWRAARWGEAGDPAGIPDDVLAQVIWQMGVTGIRKARVGALLGTDLRLYPVRWDDDLFGALFEAGRDFWYVNVLQQIEPPLRGQSAARYLAKRWPKHDERMLKSAPHVDQIARNLAKVVAGRKVAERLEEDLRAQLCAAIADAYGVEGEGYRATWGERAGSISYRDLALHLGATEEQIEQFRGAPGRQLRLSGPLFASKDKD